jgi:hypothetical protein
LIALLFHVAASHKSGVYRVHTQNQIPVMFPFLGGSISRGG